MTDRGAPGRPGHPVPGQFLAGVVRTTSPSAQASGFVIDLDGVPYLVTAAEVVGKGAHRILVTFEQANRMLQVALLGEVGAGRAAVSRITSANFLPCLDTAPSDWVPGASQRVFSLGFPRGIRGLRAAANVPFVLGGAVAAVSVEDGPVFYVDGSFNPGMVGGPVLCAISADEPPVVLGVTLGRQPIETNTAADVLSPGTDRGLAVDASVVAVLGVRAVVDLIESATPSEVPPS